MQGEIHIPQHLQATIQRAKDTIINSSKLKWIDQETFIEKLSKKLVSSSHRKKKRKPGRPPKNKETATLTNQSTLDIYMK